ncbi:MAG TPA: helix-turn-helix domain-containing protein [Propioniciclava sp.]|jgi:DNA-binding HxlR family transcriptional regulator|uniref:winged helix-turn-helix transcriptional regulator n=1 Tax=Propioniciclava sp. TaxID=2038686 RepID=UPI002D00DB49|nr:helix-turn-helix domain-containing protein [Propioniciclava sp.]HRL48932.1 helix-turn-helix domain-containing protein [Propioniciclava sp.]HRL81242.1 helix-turn-helix domain-containing protein [Propioniciclava sp.]
MTDEAFDPYHRACPSRRLLNEIGELWTVLVVGALAEGPLRFKDVAARVDGISFKMLTQTLRTLERDSLVTRTQYPEVPPRVEYELTATGRELVAPLRALEDWATSHMADILAARERFDADPA